MRFFDTFTGYGGFTLGIQRAYELQTLETKPEDSSDTQKRTPQHAERPLCIGYSEINKYAIQVYEKHFNHKPYGDITKIKAEELPDFDLLTGGFPCQAFSIAGKRKGFDDTRGTLFFDIARILKVKRPRNFILENVKGLLSHDNGRTFKVIITTLVELGYCVEWQVLNAKDFGVPQNRERVFIVGHLGGVPERKVFPIGEDDRLGASENKVANTLTSNYWKGAAASRPIPTDGVKIRRLTPLECERLMGLPDNWTAEGTEGKMSDTQRYKLCGNGVVVNVVEEIVRRLYNLK